MEEDYVILDSITLKPVNETTDKANLNYLQKVYKYLRAINATKSQHLVSVDYLGKGQDYLSLVYLFLQLFHLFFRKINNYFNFLIHFAKPTI